MAWAAARLANLPDASQALVFWTVQIAFNTLWSGIFFGLRNMATGGVIIVALWIAVCTTMTTFWQHDQIGSLLFIPYLIWVTLAFALNWSVWARKRTPA